MLEMRRRCAASSSSFVRTMKVSRLSGAIAQDLVEHLRHFNPGCGVDAGRVDLRKPNMEVVQLVGGSSGPTDSRLMKSVAVPLNLVGFLG